MSATTLAIVAGLLSGAVTSFVGWVLTRRDTRERLRIAQEESAANVRESAANVEKTLAEAEQIRLEVEQARTSGAKNVAGAVSYAASRTASVMVYDGRDGSDPFDFHKEEYEGAQSHITRHDGLLVIERTNTEGRVLLRLDSYAGPDGRVALLKRRDDSEAEAVRHLRVKCQVRAVDAEHTVLLRLVAKNALPNEYLGRWRERLVPGAWVPIDWYLEIPSAEDCYFRIDDRSVTAAPSAVQIRSLVITERGTP